MGKYYHYNLKITVLSIDVHRLFSPSGGGLHNAKTYIVPFSVHNTLIEPYVIDIAVTDLNLRKLYKTTTYSYRNIN